jgi:GNAT superfamily N-acetyltransferase
MVTVRIAEDVKSRCAVLAVAHAANRVTEPLPWYQAHRLCAPARARATWWLLEDDGEPVSSLVCYPLSLRHGGLGMRGIPVGGYGLGAVATRPERQQRGHAARLCAAVMEANTGIGLLFSAIPPAYYAKLGFRVLPVSEHACMDLGALIASAPRADLRPMDPRMELRALMDAYDRDQSGLHMLRDERGWRSSLEKNPEDRFFEVDGGYLRVVVDDEGLDLVELVSTAPAEAWRAAASLAQLLGYDALTTWLTPPPELAELLQPRSRHRTQLMVAGPSEITSATLSSADYF